MNAKVMKNKVVLKKKLWLTQKEHYGLISL